MNTRSGLNKFFVTIAVIAVLLICVETAPHHHAHHGCGIFQHKSKHQIYPENVLEELNLDVTMWSYPSEPPTNEEPGKSFNIYTETLNDTRRSLRMIFNQLNGKNLLGFDISNMASIDTPYPQLNRTKTKEKLRRNHMAAIREIHKSIQKYTAIAEAYTKKLRYERCVHKLEMSNASFFENQTHKILKESRFLLWDFDTYINATRLFRKQPYMNLTEMTNYLNETGLFKGKFDSFAFTIDLEYYTKSYISYLDNLKIMTKAIYNATNPNGKRKQLRGNKNNRRKLPPGSRNSSNQQRSGERRQLSTEENRRRKHQQKKRTQKPRIQGNKSTSTERRQQVIGNRNLNNTNEHTTQKLNSLEGSSQQFSDELYNQSTNRPNRKQRPDSQQFSNESQPQLPESNPVRRQRPANRRKKLRAQQSKEQEKIHSNIV